MKKIHKCHECGKEITGFKFAVYNRAYCQKRYILQEYWCIKHWIKNGRKKLEV